MTRHYFNACDCCLKEILKDDPPHYTRLEFERGLTTNMPASLPRRDLCAACYRRISQALIQAPDSLWLLEGFEVVKK